MLILFVLPNQAVKQKKHGQQRERGATPPQIYLEKNNFVQEQKEIFQRERREAQSAPKQQLRAALPPAAKEQHAANQRRASA
jgi:hypothetical protein